MASINVGDKVVWIKRVSPRRGRDYAVAAEILAVEGIYKNGDIKTARGRFRTGSDGTAYLYEGGAMGKEETDGIVYPWRGETEATIALFLQNEAAVKAANDAEKAAEEAKKAAAAKEKLDAALAANAGRLTPSPVADDIWTVKLVDRNGIETRFVFAIRTSQEVDFQAGGLYVRHELLLTGFKWFRESWEVYMSSVWGRSIEEAIIKLVEVNW